MTDLILSTRRGFIKSIVLLIAAPAVVKASSLMKIVAIHDYERLIFRTSLPKSAWRTIYSNDFIREALDIETFIRPPLIVPFFEDYRNGVPMPSQLRFRRAAFQEHCSESDWFD